MLWFATMNRYSKNLGIFSSVLAALLTTLFGVFVVLNDKLIYFTSVLFLSISVVIMIVSMKTFIPQQKEVFVSCAIAFGVVYAVLVSMVYYAQISVVLKGTLSSDLLNIVSDSPGTVFFFIDMLGYSFLCLATLFMAFAIDRRDLLFRISLLIHSALFIPTFLLPFLPITFSTAESSGSTSGNFVLLAWCIIFVPVCLLLARYFIKQKTS